MKKIAVKRLSTSSYFSADFILKEKNKIESLGFEYVGPTEGILNEDQPQVWITNTHTRLPTHLPHALKFILHPNSGYDNFTTTDFKHDIPIILGNEIRSQAVIEFILSIIFHHFVSLPHFESWPQSRAWPRRLISSKNALIIGYGQIGQKISQILELLGCKIHVIDPYQGVPSCYKNDSHAYDLIILCCSYNKKNEKMVDEKFLAQLKKRSLFINTARGELVNEESLLSYFSNHPTSTAYLDVFQEEPQDFKKWKSFSNITPFPHIAGVFNELENHMINFEAKVLNDFKSHSFERFLNIYQNHFLNNRKYEDSWI